MSALATAIEAHLDTEFAAAEAQRKEVVAAFRAGWEARTNAIDDYLMHDITPDVDAAWAAYQE